MTKGGLNSAAVTPASRRGRHGTVQEAREGPIHGLVGFVDTLEPAPHHGQQPLGFQDLQVYILTYSSSS